MKKENLIKLKTIWQLNTDGYGSQFKSLDDNIIAVELKKVGVGKNITAYNSVKLMLNSFFDNKYFNISECKEFKITYKSMGIHSLILAIEENSDIYNYYYILPPSEYWTTKTIKIRELLCNNNERLEPDLKRITGFVFNLMFSTNNEYIGNLYIKKFIIKGYEIVLLDRRKYSGYTNFLLKKSLLNNITAYLLNKNQHKNKSDSEGNPLYCIYPFYEFRIARRFLTVCCDIKLDENIDFAKNKNLLDVWWGDKFNEIREGIKDLSYSKCNLKKCVIYNTTRESFKNLQTIKKEYPDIADYLEGKVENFKGFPHYIISSFDSACNLTCKSCNVSNIKNLSMEIGQKYIQQIEELGSNVERILLSGYGDPFASPIYKKWLYNFPSNKFPKLKTIELFTNAILWTKENWNKVTGSIKKLNITAVISIDGATKETYEYNRGNAKFETLIENLRFISDLRKKNEINALALCFVIQNNNYKEIPLMIDFAEKYLFDSIYFSQIINWDTYTKEEFNKINVFDKKHPEFKNFKKIYNDIRNNKNRILQMYFNFKL